jgi:chorismate dehydratase
MDKVKISAVTYLNSKPLIYGLRHLPIQERIELSLDIPSVCADKLLSGAVDVGLVPVAVLPGLREHHVLGDCCIGAVGPVSSVMLYSNVPLEHIDSVYLDYQSRTSVKLVQVLARNYWNIRPRWMPAEEGYEAAAVSGTTGAVIIGDRTFSLNGKYAYQYDLAEEWNRFTGLPFVFACWVANRPLEAAFVEEFSEAVRYGISRRDEAIAEWAGSSHYPVDAKTYLEKYISYHLDAVKREGMSRFLELASAL